MTKNQTQRLRDQETKRHQISLHRHFERREKSLSSAARDSRFPRMCRAVPLSSYIPQEKPPREPGALVTSQRTPLFSILPLEGGAPKGRKLALEAVFSHVGMPTPPRFARLPLPEEGARMIFNRASPHIYLRRSRHIPHSSGGFSQNQRTPRPRLSVKFYSVGKFFQKQ